MSQPEKRLNPWLIPDSLAPFTMGGPYGPTAYKNSGYIGQHRRASGVPDWSLPASDPLSDNLGASVRLDEFNRAAGVVRPVTDRPLMELSAAGAPWAVDDRMVQALNEPEPNGRPTFWNRAADFAGSAVEEIARSFYFWEDDIGWRERTWRILNTASLAVPIGLTWKLAESTAGAALPTLRAIVATSKGRVALGALESAAISAGIETMRDPEERGEHGVMLAALAGGVGGTIGAKLVDKGIKAANKARWGAALEPFQDPQMLTEIGGNPLLQHKWAIISNAVPASEVAAADPAKLAHVTALNQALHDGLVERLNDNGIVFAPTKVFKAGKESHHAVFVAGMDQEEALAIARSFKQTEVITDRGFFNLADGTVRPTEWPSLRVGGGVNRDMDDFYSLTLRDSPTPIPFTVKPSDLAVTIEETLPAGIRQAAESAIDMAKTEDGFLGRFWRSMRDLDVGVSTRRLYQKVVYGRNGWDKFQEATWLATRRANADATQILAHTVPRVEEDIGRVAQMARNHWNGHLSNLVSWTPRQFRNPTLPVLSKLTGEPLLPLEKILENAGVKSGEMADFQIYGFAKFYKDLLGNETRDIALPKAVERLGAQGVWDQVIDQAPEHWQKALDGVRDWYQQSARDILVGSEMVSAADFNKFISRHPNWVPLSLGDEVVNLDEAGGSFLAAIKQIGQSREGVAWPEAGRKAAELQVAGAPKSPISSLAKEVPEGARHVPWLSEMIVRLGAFGRMADEQLVVRSLVDRSDLFDKGWMARFLREIVPDPADVEEAAKGTVAARAAKQARVMRQEAGPGLEQLGREQAAVRTEAGPGMDDMWTRGKRSKVVEEVEARTPEQLYDDLVKDASSQGLDILEVEGRLQDIPGTEHLQTGETADLTLWHGTRTSPGQGYHPSNNPFNVPILGPGMYLGSAHTAQEFGDVARYQVHLENPLVIRTWDEWKAISKDLGMPYPKRSVLTAEEASAAKEMGKKFDKWLTDQGYDSFVIKGSWTKNWGPDELMEWAGGNQVYIPAEHAKLNVKMLAKETPEQIDAIKRSSLGIGTKQSVRRTEAGPGAPGAPELPVDATSPPARPVAPSDPEEAAKAAVSQMRETEAGLESMVTAPTSGPVPGSKHLIRDVRFNQDGEPVVRMFEVTDPELWDSIQQMGPQHVATLAQLMGGAASLMRAGTTGAAEFVSKNLGRDVAYAWVNAGVSPLAFLKGVASLIKKDEFFSQWLSSGGTRAAISSMDHRMVEGLVRGAGKSKLSSVMRNPIQGFIALSENVENATRLGAFRWRLNQLTEKGMPLDQAIKEAGLLSREATVDFQSVGTSSMVANFRISTAFWGAAMSSADNMAKAIASDPQGWTLRAMAGITMPSVMLYLWNRKNPDYTRLSDSERDLFWHIPRSKAGMAAGMLAGAGVGGAAGGPAGMAVGGVAGALAGAGTGGALGAALGEGPESEDDMWLRFPKPFEPGLVAGTLVERFLQAVDQEDPKILDETASRMFSEMFGGYVPIPTMIGPWYENLVNASRLTGAPIEPHGMEDIDPTYRATRATSQLAKKLAEWYNSGLPDPETHASPAHIENYMRGYTGSLGRFFYQDVPEGVSSVWEWARGTKEALGGQRPERDILEVMPGARAFVSSFPQNARPISDIYKLAERVRNSQATNQFLEKSLMVDDLVDWVQQRAMLAGIDQGLQGVLTKMREMQEARIQVENSALDPGLKRQAIREMLDAMVTYSDMFLKAIDTATGIRPNPAGLPGINLANPIDVFGTVAKQKLPSERR